MDAVLVLRTARGPEQRMPVSGERVSIGRAPENDLTYPGDHQLSRQHFQLERSGNGWLVRDLSSSNGTYVNGRRITEHRLQPGDRITAGSLMMWMETPEPAGNEMMTTLDTAVRSGFVSAQAASTERHMRALVRAGRELAALSATEDFFDWTICLAVESVEAERGLIAVLEEGQWVTRASRGDSIEISTTVRDRVASERISLLVRDTGEEQFVVESHSLIIQQVRSLIAAPLETGERVLGLIYVDRRQAPSFTTQDLNLLTILANMAAIRLEHERLAGVEESRRERIREMEAAAEAHRRALEAAELLRHAETRAVLAETAASLGKLSAAISHELNTPLGALRSSVETLLSAVARARQSSDPMRIMTVAQDLSGSIRSSVTRLSEIIGRLQRFTNLDRAEVQSIELGQFLRDVIAATQSEAPERVQIDVSESIRVVSRPQQLSAAFAAILESAHGPVRLTAKPSEHGVEVTMRVPDVFVPDEDLPGLFDPAFRAHEGRMATENWGLFSARQLIRESGGDIQAESDSDRGTVFTILIRSESAS